MTREVETDFKRTPTLKTYFHRAIPTEDGNTELQTIISVASFRDDKKYYKEEEMKYEEHTVALKPFVVPNPKLPSKTPSTRLKSRRVTVHEIAIPFDRPQKKRLHKAVPHAVDPFDDKERRKALELASHFVSNDDDEDDISEKLNGRPIRHEVASVASEQKDIFTQLIDALIDMDGSKPAFVDNDIDKDSYCTSFTRDTFLSREITDGDTVLNLEEEEKLLLFCSTETAKIHVDEYQTWAFNRVVAYLKTNENLSELTVCRGGAHTRTGAQMKQFLDEVGALKNLRKLVLLAFAKEDVEVLELILIVHPTLECLHLHLASGTIKRPLLKAIASIPYLEELKIEVNASFPVAVVLESKSLKSLCVMSKNFLFRDNHMLAVGSRMEHNHTLTWLDIMPQMSQFAFRVLVYALRRNTTLTSLLVSIVGNAQESDKSLTELSETLKINSTIGIVWNHSYQLLNVSNETKEDVLELMEVRTVKKFHVFDEDAIFWLKKKTAMERRKLDGMWCRSCRFDLWNWVCAPCSDDPNGAWVQEFQEDQVF